MSTDEKPKPWNGYYTPEQVSRLKDVSRGAVYSAMHGTKGQAPRLTSEDVAGRRMIRAEHAEAWMPAKTHAERGRRGAASRHKKQEAA